MGLIKAALGAASGVLEDQWKDFFYCDALDADTLAAKGQKRAGKRSSNTGASNIITQGSVIAVNEGQCMMIVEQGRIVELSAEPGEYVYDQSSEPTVFGGDLENDVVAVLKNMASRFTFGGGAGKDQRVYFFNLKEITGNKFGTAQGIQFNAKVGPFSRYISLRCFGEYSYQIANPLTFYQKVCGNMPDVFERNNIDSQLKSELLDALGPALSRLSAQGVDYAEILAHKRELKQEMREELKELWQEKRGIELVSFAIASLKASEEDEAKLAQLQEDAALSDPRMSRGRLAGSMAEAMKTAAGNEGGMGAAFGFMGMNMAQQAGGAAMQMFGTGGSGNPLAEGGNPLAPQTPAATPKQNAPQTPQQNAAGAGEAWDCPACGHAGNTGKFCVECGGKKPEAQKGWHCPDCGTLNQGKFCMNCGAKKPAAAPLYRCDKCGWQPEDPAHPPKFCPNCGDRFDENDQV